LSSLCLYLGPICPPPTKRRPLRSSKSKASTFLFSPFAFSRSSPTLRLPPCLSPGSLKKQLLFSPLAGSSSPAGPCPFSVLRLLNRAFFFKKSDSLPFLCCTLCFPRTNPFPHPPPPLSLFFPELCRRLLGFTPSSPSRINPSEKTGGLLFVSLRVFYPLDCPFSHSLAAVWSFFSSVRLVPFGSHFLQCFLCAGFLFFLIVYPNFRDFSPSGLSPRRFFRSWSFFFFCMDLDAFLPPCTGWLSPGFWPRYPAFGFWEMTIWGLFPLFPFLNRSSRLTSRFFVPRGFFRFSIVDSRSKIRVTSRGALPFVFWRMRPFFRTALDPALFFWGLFSP